MRMTRLTTLARTGRRTKISVNFTASSVILGVGCELGLGPDVVVDDDARAVAQLAGAGRDDFLARIDALQNRHEVAARRPHAHELLAPDLDRLAIGIARRVTSVLALVLNDE